MRHTELVQYHVLQNVRTSLGDSHAANAITGTAGSEIVQKYNQFGKTLGIHESMVSWMVGVIVGLSGKKPITLLVLSFCITPQRQILQNISK